MIKKKIKYFFNRSQSERQKGEVARERKRESSKSAGLNCLWFTGAVHILFLPVNTWATTLEFRPASSRDLSLRQHASVSRALCERRWHYPSHSHPATLPHSYKFITTQLAALSTSRQRHLVRVCVCVCVCVRVRARSRMRTCVCVKTE